MWQAKPMSKFSAPIDRGKLSLSTGKSSSYFLMSWKTLRLLKLRIWRAIRNTSVEGKRRTRMSIIIVSPFTGGRTAGFLNQRCTPSKHDQRFITFPETSLMWFYPLRWRLKEITVWKPRNWKINLWSCLIDFENYVGMSEVWEGCG